MRAQRGVSESSPAKMLVVLLRAELAHVDDARGALGGFVLGVEQLFHELERVEALARFAGLSVRRNHAVHEARLHQIPAVPHARQHQRDRGNTFAENLMTIGYTARKHHKGVLDFLTACCNAARDDVPPPSLFGAAAG